MSVSGGWIYVENEEGRLYLAPLIELQIVDNNNKGEPKCRKDKTCRILF